MEISHRKNKNDDENDSENGTRHLNNGYCQDDDDEKKLDTTFIASEESQDIEHLSEDFSSQKSKSVASQTEDVSVCERRGEEEEGRGDEEEEEEKAVTTVMIDEGSSAMIYQISQIPPVHLLFMFAMQQSLLFISIVLGKAVIVAEVLCATNDDYMKTQLLSGTFLMTGIATLLMPWIGIRLPIFQGTSSSYMVPLISLMNQADWKCPPTTEGIDPVTNMTITFAKLGNDTLVPMRDVIVEKILQLSGALMAVGGLHFLIAVTGLVGVIVRYVGPITIVPTVILLGLQIKSVAVKFCQTNWAVAVITAASSVIFSIFLGKRKTPIPFWSRARGFHIFWYPFHQVFSILLGILIGWAVSWIMTEAGALSNDPNNHEFLARTDARTNVITQAEWITFPYPGKFGMYSFSIGGFISFIVGSILTIIDSVGDFQACARTTNVPPPPSYAFNRGIALEGLICIFGGAVGCCHATSSASENIGAVAVTRVASRSVFILSGVIYIVFAVVGKIGGVFITVPYSVLGGTTIVSLGILIGVIMSYLQTIDLNSTRNLALMGISMLVGTMMPYWVEQNSDAISTGNATADSALEMLLSNPAFVAGFMACILDNIAPGTLKERGLYNPYGLLEDDGGDNRRIIYDEGVDLYRIPFIPDYARKYRIFKYIPIIDYTGD